MKKQLLLVMTVAAVLVSCGGSSPSGSDINDALMEYISSASGGNYSVVDVSKTDGQLREDGVYIADYVAEVEFKRCTYRIRKWSHVAPVRNCMAQPGNTFETKVLNKQYGVGYVAKFLGQAWFTKKESGWKLSSISVAEEQ